MLVLHVGCADAKLPFYMGHCEEVRLDIDPTHGPDIVGDMVHLPDDIGPFDAVFSCHSLEHLMPYDVDTCLRGFHKVLKPGGSVIIFVPDLEGLIPNDELLYVSDGGPVYAFDLFYGHRLQIKEFPFMAHHCGFVKETLKDALEKAGFMKCKAERMPLDGPFAHNLFGFGVKK